MVARLIVVVVFCVMSFVLFVSVLGRYRDNSRSCKFFSSIKAILFVRRGTSPGGLGRNSYMGHSFWDTVRCVVTSVRLVPSS